MSRSKIGLVIGAGALVGASVSGCGSSTLGNLGSKQHDLIVDQVPKSPFNAEHRAACGDGGLTTEGSGALLRWPYLYTRLEPKDNKGWRALLRARYGAAKQYTGFEKTIPIELAAMEPDVRQLIGASRTADDLNAVAWFCALTKQPHIGVNFAVRAIQRAPNCGECFDTLALLRYQQGDFAAAIAAQEHALRMAAHKPWIVGLMEKQLAIFKKAAAERGSQQDH